MRTIENLAFKGGGVLGIAYAGALEILEEQKILQNIKQVAGTSAGSILATLVSLRYDAAEIKTLVNATNFKKFEDGFDPLRIAGKYGLYKGDYFLAWIKGLIGKKSGNENLTFGEMAAKGYLDLKVFSTDLNQGALQEFSAEKTPNTIVGEAVRASMSIPLFFEAWQFPNGIPNNHLYADGGLIYNFPISVFDLDKTLGLFLYNPNEKTTDLTQGHLVKYIGDVVKTMLKAQGTNLKENAAELAATVMIDNCGISPIDFKLSDDDKTKLFASGKKAMTAYLNPVA